MKVYTVIDSFDDDGLWVANYRDEKDAIECFSSYLERMGCLNDDGMVKCDNGETSPVEVLFRHMLQEGFGYDYYGENGCGRLFVRDQLIQDHFDYSKMPWG